MSRLFTGACVALATPFQENGAVDFDALSHMLEFQIENGTDAILVCGTTGEPSTMTREEQKASLIFRKTGGRPRSRDCVHRRQQYSRSDCQISRCPGPGVDGLLIVTPYYNKTTQAG